LTDVAAQPQGFRGWLMLLAFGVCLTPLRTLVEFVKAFEEYGRAWTVPNGQAVVVFEVGINLALIVLEVSAVVAMLNRRRVFIKLFIWLWGAAFVLPLADMGGRGVAVSACPERVVRRRNRPYAPDNDHSRLVGLVPSRLGAREEHLHELSTPSHTL